MIQRIVKQKSDLMGHLGQMVERVNELHSELDGAMFKPYSLQSTIETLEKGVKYVQVNNKNTRTMPLTSFLLLTLNMFHTCFYC